MTHLMPGLASSATTSRPRVMAMSRITISGVLAIASRRASAAVFPSPTTDPVRTRDGADHALSKNRVWINDNDLDGFAHCWSFRLQKIAATDGFWPDALPERSIC